MRNRAAVVLSSAVFALLLAVLWSCGSDSGSPTKPGPDPDPDPDPPLSHAWTTGVVGLPPADSAVLDSAGARYRTLRLAGTAESARASLVTALTSGWDGVAAAGVTVDGTTIQINFTDGIKAILVTDETFHTAGGEEVAGLSRQSSAPTGLRTLAAGSADCAPSSGPQGDVGCADMVVPGSSKVRVVNSAAPTSSNAPAVSRKLKEGLSALGWDEDDIEIRESSGRLDRDFTPEDIFDQEEAGVVAIVAQGAVVSQGNSSPMSGDNVAFAMQAFNGGEYSEYDGQVTPERWAEYEQWQKEGKIILGQAWSSSSQTMVNQAFIREDLLSEELHVGEGTLINFVAPQSAATGNLDLMAGTASGPGAATGWDGFVAPDQAAAAVVALTGNMAGTLTNTDPSSFSDAFDVLEEDGGTVLNGSGATSNMVGVSGTDNPLFLPAKIDFDAPFSCLEEGTVFYEVDVKYSVCPGLDQSFDFFPGGEFSLDGLPPYGAEISYQAKDAEGKVVGAGIYDLDLAGGGNEVDLCPCWGKVDVDFSGVASVPGIDAGAQLQFEVNFTDPSYPQATLEMDVSTLADRKGWESFPGEATVVQTLVDGAGNVLGYAEEEEVDLRCDENATSDLCFGWIELTPNQAPSETSAIVVTATSDHSWIEPSQVTLSPGSQANIGGLLVGDNVHVSAEARSATGEVLGTLEFDQVLECGPNQTELTFPTPGLVLSVSKTRAPASGYAGSFITGTVRQWQEGDTDEPTGSPLPGVDVYFNTDLGRFQVTQTTHDSHVVRAADENGFVWVYMTSLDEGTATINAFVEDPPIEADPVTVEFEKPLKLVVDNSPDPYEGYLLPDTSQAIRQYCIEVQRWNNGELVFEDTDLEPVAHFFVFPGHHVIGEVVKFVWIPGTNCPAQNYGYTEPYINGAWLHYYHGGPYGSQNEDYAHQKTVFMLGEKNPLTQVVEFQLTLLDPTKASSSPFDLSAPEQFVLNGFR